MDIEHRKEFVKNILKLQKKTFLIAEIGVNHNGSVQLAKEMVQVAKESGADAVKFQTYKTEELVVKSSPMVNYQKENYTDKLSYYEMLKKHELSYDQFSEINDYCTQQEIIFFSKGYLTQLDFLDSLDVLLHKVDSASIIYHELIHAVAARGKLVLLSTGMATLQEIISAVEIIRSYKTPLVVLHCTSAYPTPAEAINLSRMSYLSKVFNEAVGFSDHSQGCTAALAAVALGAQVVEKHFTLDKKMKGPDHKASIEPEEFKTLAQGIRFLETAMGDPLAGPSRDECENRKIMRRSWHYIENFEPGHIVRKNDLAFVRPNNGLAGEAVAEVLGCRLTRSVVSGNPVVLSDFVER